MRQNTPHPKELKAKAHKLWAKNTSNRQGSMDESEMTERSHSSTQQPPPPVVVKESEQPLQDADLVDQEEPDEEVPVEVRKHSKMIHYTRYI